MPMEVWLFWESDLDSLSTNRWSFRKTWTALKRWGWNASQRVLQRNSSAARTGPDLEDIVCRKLRSGIRIVRVCNETHFWELDRNPQSALFYVIVKINRREQDSRICSNKWCQHLILQLTRFTLLWSTRSHHKKKTEALLISADVSRFSNFWILIFKSTILLRLIDSNWFNSCRSQNDFYTKRASFQQEKHSET